MLHLTRRHFMDRLGFGLGGIALQQLLTSESQGLATKPAPDLPHFPAKAKRVIVLFMSGGLSQYESFCYKPELMKMAGQELPDSWKKGRSTLLGMSGAQSHFTLARPSCEFSQHGQSGLWLSSHFPQLGKMADELCILQSMKSDAVNHDPAMTFMQTGAQLPGRPSMGSWITYGLGSESANLPAFTVLVSKVPTDQPLSSRLWDSGFLPTKFQGVQFRPSKDPVTYLTSPVGVDRVNEELLLRRHRKMQELKTEDRSAAADIDTRIQQYEMAFRMQQSIPEVTDFSQEPESVKALYGPDVSKPGSFAANCLLARRLSEKGVRFIQLYHPGWDMHGGLVANYTKLATQVDHGAAGLLQDLKNRGMLQDTLVVFATEFGRTPYSQGKYKTDPLEFGREHHRDSFSMWMAGGGIKGGLCHGVNDEIGFHSLSDEVHVNDFHATMLHLLGVDHERFTHRFQGRDFRLTDVAGKVVKQILA